MDKFELEELAKDVAEKVKALVQEGNVTRIRIRKDDTVILNLPMTAGVVGTVIGAAAAPWAASCRFSRSTFPEFVTDIVTPPAEGTNLEVLDGHNPETSDEILHGVLVGVINALPRIDTCLVVQPAMAVAF